MSLEGEEGPVWEERGAECSRERRSDGLMGTDLGTQELEGSQAWGPQSTLDGARIMSG